tara:strand:+ start:179 stop:619 length:441 start_codon:yes stop_codon:yes gene_type:complete
MSKVSSWFTMFNKRNWYPVVSKSGNYTTIKKNNEQVILHPSLDIITIFKRVGVLKDHRFEVNNIHSTKCHCKKCNGLRNELLDAAANIAAPTYLTVEQADQIRINEKIDNFRKAGFNIAGVIDKNDPEAMRGMMQDIKDNIDKEKE